MSHLPFLFLILAAGKGTRMHSELPKVLHPVGNLPLIGHVLRTVQSLSSMDQTIIVLSPNLPAVETYVHQIYPTAKIVYQDQPLGTGHAVQTASDTLKDFQGIVLIMFGDTPLVTLKTLQEVLKAFTSSSSSPDLVVVGFKPQESKNYGQIVLDDHGNPLEIVETKHQTFSQKSLKTLCNSGIMAFKAKQVSPLLQKIKKNPESGEYYLTDLVALARDHKLKIHLYQAENETEFAGINNRLDLAEVEAIWQQRQRQQFCLKGVTLKDPSSVYFSYDTQIEADVTVHPQVVFGPEVKIDSKVEILPFCHLEGCHVKSKVRIGPFARLRPQTIVEESVRIGNFVELKNATLGTRSKINHLSYVGDAKVGKETNIGAGTITCNYDGFQKWTTRIGENVLIGANSALIAPLTIGDGAIIGAGSTLTKDVPEACLSVGRGKQIDRLDGARRLRHRAQQKLMPPPLDKFHLKD